MTFSQGGYDNLQHTEAEVKVATEKTVGHVTFEIAVRGGDDANVNLDRFAAADAFERMSFEHSQKLRLNRGTHFADFVEHERTLVSGFELADLAFRGPGKRTAFMAEQFAGQKIGRQRSAIEADENILASRAVVMHAACDQFLAHSAFRRGSTPWRCWQRREKSPR